MPNLSGRAGLKRCVLRVIQTTGGATRFRRAIAAAHDEEFACAPSSARGDRPQRIARPAHADTRAALILFTRRFVLSPPPHPCLRDGLYGREVVRVRTRAASRFPTHGCSIHAAQSTKCAECDVCSSGDRCSASRARRGHPPTEFLLVPHARALRSYCFSRTNVPPLCFVNPPPC